MIGWSGLGIPQRTRDFLFCVTSRCDVQIKTEIGASSHNYISQRCATNNAHYTAGLHHCEVWFWPTVLLRLFNRFSVLCTSSRPAPGATQSPWQCESEPFSGGKGAWGFALNTLPCSDDLYFCCLFMLPLACYGATFTFNFLLEEIKLSSHWFQLPSYF